MKNKNMEYDFETEYFDIWALGAEAAWKGVANVLEGELHILAKYLYWQPL